MHAFFYLIRSHSNRIVSKDKHVVWFMSDVWFVVGDGELDEIGAVRFVQEDKACAGN
jgi:hypothetical protein